LLHKMNQIEQSHHAKNYLAKYEITPSYRASYCTYRSI
jgi:hypothetical protein